MLDSAVDKINYVIFNGRRKDLASVVSLVSSVASDDTNSMTPPLSRRPQWTVSTASDRRVDLSPVQPLIDAMLCQDVDANCAPLAGRTLSV